MGPKLRVYSRIRAQLPWLYGRSLNCIDGLSSGRRLSYVSLRRGGAEWDSLERGAEHDVGHMSGPRNGRLAHLSSGHGSLDVK